MTKVCGMVLAALVAAPLAADAQTDGVRGRWSATFAAGAVVPAGGEFHEGGSGTVLALPTAVNAKAYSDVYDPGFGWRAGIGYGVSRHVEVIADFAWQRSESKDLSVGNVAGLDLRAKFGEYQSYGLEAGIRHHFAPESTVTPYLSLVGGFRRVDAIPGTFRVPAAGVTLADTPFFDESTVATFGGSFGLLFGASNVKFGIEGGLRYHADLSDLEGLAGTGLENLNDAGSSWSIPISGVVRIGF
jgi:hypothetical protein